MGEKPQQNPQSPPSQEVAPPVTTAITTTTTAVTATAITNSTTESVIEPPPSKIPLRPSKIRKLSPENPNPKPPYTSSSSKPPRARASQQRSAAVALVPRVQRSLSCDGEVDTAIRHLRAADPLLASLIDVHPSPVFDSFQTPFLALTKSILYQQLAYKAGTSIYTRFISLCGGESSVVPETILTLTPQQLRQVGVSGRKASYLHDLARKYQTGILSDNSIVNMDDKSLFAMLTMVNGIGSWSVHMFMIFSLHRPDVLPVNDLSVRKGVQMLYNLEELPRPSQMDQLCAKWRPYRSIGAWYMWKFVQSRGVPSSAAAVAAGVGLQEHQQHLHHHQQEPQLIDPINSILNLGNNCLDASSFTYTGMAHTSKDAHIRGVGSLESGK